MRNMAARDEGALPFSVFAARLPLWASLRKEVALMEQFLLDVLANVLAGVSWFSLPLTSNGRPEMSLPR